jgi:hypothetical protein
MAEKFSFRRKDVSGSNLVALRIDPEAILFMDRDLTHGVAEDINHASLPYRNILDHSFCWEIIRKYVDKYSGNPHFSQNLTH